MKRHVEVTRIIKSTMSKGLNVMFTQVNNAQNFQRWLTYNHNVKIAT